MSVSGISHSNFSLNAIATAFGAIKQDSAQKANPPEALYYIKKEGKESKPDRLVTHGRLVTKKGDLERSIYQGQTSKAIKQSTEDENYKGHEGYEIDYDEIFLQGCTKLEKEATAAGFKIPKRISLEYKEREHLKQVASRHEDYCMADPDLLLEKTKGPRNKYERKLAVACKRRDYIETLVQEQTQGLANILQTNDKKNAVYLSTELTEKLGDILKSCPPEKAFISKPYQTKIQNLFKEHGLYAKENINIKRAIKNLKNYQGALGKFNQLEQPTTEERAEDPLTQINDELKEIIKQANKQTETQIEFINYLNQETSSDKNILKLFSCLSNPKYVAETTSEIQLKDKFTAWSGKNNSSNKRKIEWLKDTLNSCQNNLEKTYNEIAESYLKQNGTTSEKIEALKKFKEELEKKFPALNHTKNEENNKNHKWSQDNNIYAAKVTGTNEERQNIEIASKIIEKIIIKTESTLRNKQQKIIDEVHKNRDALLESLIPTLKQEKTSFASGKESTSTQSIIDTIAPRILQKQEELNAAKLINGSISINSDSCFLCPVDFTLKDLVQHKIQGTYSDANKNIKKCTYKIEEIKNEQGNIDEYKILCLNNDNTEIKDNPWINTGKNLVKKIDEIDNKFVKFAIKSKLKEFSREFQLIQPYGVYLDKDNYIHDCYYQIKKNEYGNYAIFCLNKKTHEEIKDNPSIPKDGKAIESMKDMQEYFSEKDTSLLFKKIDEVKGESIQNKLSNFSFEDLAVTHKQHHEILEATKNQVNRVFKKETKSFLDQRNIKTVYGSGYSYNAGLYGENHGVNHRQIMYEAVFNLAEDGEIIHHGSCGDHQNSGLHNIGHQEADGSRQPGNIVSVQSYTGKLFLSSPRGNDPETVDEKITTIRVAPHSNRSGFHEKAVFAYLQNNNEITNGIFFNRNEKALSIPILIEEHANNANANSEEINIPILHPNGTPLIGIDQFKLSQASQDLLNLPNQETTEDQSKPKDKITNQERIKQLLSPNKQQSLTLELIHELPTPLQNSDGTAFVDDEGKPVTQRSSIQVQYNPKLKAFVLTHLEHWDTAPKGSANDPHTAELVDIVHDNGHIEQVAVLTYKRNNWGERKGIGNNSIAENNALKKLTQEHLRAAPLSDGYIVKDDAVHTQFVNKKFLNTDNEDSHSIRPNDLPTGKLSIPASSAYNRESHPVAIKPNAPRESGIVTSHEKRGITTNQPHSDMNKAEGGDAKLNPYLSSPLPDIDPKYWGNRHGNKEAIDSGNYLNEEQSVQTNLTAIFSGLSKKKTTNTDEVPIQEILKAIKEQNNYTKKRITYTKDQAYKKGILLEQIKNFDELLKKLELEKSNPEFKSFSIKINQEQLTNRIGNLRKLITTNEAIKITKTKPSDRASTSEPASEVEIIGTNVEFTRDMQDDLLNKGFNGSNGFDSRTDRLFSNDKLQTDESPSSSSSGIGVGNKSTSDNNSSTSLQSEITPEDSDSIGITPRPNSIQSQLYTDFEVLEKIIEQSFLFTEKQAKSGTNEDLGNNTNWSNETDTTNTPQPTNKQNLTDTIDNKQLNRLTALWKRHENNILTTLKNDNKLTDANKRQKALDTLIDLESSKLTNAITDNTPSSQVTSDEIAPSAQQSGYTQSSRSPFRRSFWKNPGQIPVAARGIVATGSVVTTAASSASTAITQAIAELTNTGQMAAEAAATIAGTAAATTMNLGFGALLGTMGAQIIGAANKELKRIRWTAQRYHEEADKAEQDTLNTAKTLGLNFQRIEDIPLFEKERKVQVEEPAKRNLEEQGFGPVTQEAVIADFINQVAKARLLRAKSNLFKRNKIFQWLNLGTGTGYVSSAIASAFGSLALVSGHALEALSAGVGKSTLAVSAAPLAVGIANVVTFAGLFIAGSLATIKKSIDWTMLKGLTVKSTQGDLGIDSGIRRQGNIGTGHKKAELRQKLALWSVFTGSSGALLGLSIAGLAFAVPTVGASLVITIIAGTLLAGSTLGLYVQTHRERNGRTSTAAEDSLHIRGNYLSKDRRLNRLNNNVNKQMGEAIRVRLLSVDALSQKPDGIKFRKSFEFNWYGFGAHGPLRSLLRRFGMSGGLFGRKLSINGDYDANAFLAKYMAEDTKSVTEVSTIRKFEMDIMTETTDSEINYLETQQKEYRNELEVMKKEDEQLKIEQNNIIQLSTQIESTPEQSEKLVAIGKTVKQLLKSHKTRSQEIEQELKIIDLRILDLLEMKKSIALLFNFNDRIMNEKHKEQFDKLRWRFLIAFDALGDVLTEKQLFGLSKINNELKTKSLSFNGIPLDKNQAGFMKSWVKGEPVELINKPRKLSRVDFTLGEINAKRFVDLAAMAKQFKGQKDGSISTEAAKAFEYLNTNKTNTPFDIDHLFARFITIHQSNKMRNEQNSLTNTYIENRRQEVNQPKKKDTEDSSISSTTSIKSWASKLLQKKQHNTISAGSANLGLGVLDGASGLTGVSALPS